jgi:ATP-binding cassette subfamily F protein 3
MALAAFHAPHLLILDEPTNHLDVDAREALVLALNEFEGCVILITHDRHLIEATADRLWLVDRGTVAPFDGDIDDYAGYVLDRARQLRRGTSSARAPKKETARRDPAPLRKMIGDVDQAIAGLQEKIDILDRALGDPRLYAEDPRKAQEFAALRARLQTDLDQAEHHWLGLQEELERLD